MKRILIAAVLVGLLVLSGSTALAEEKSKDKNWDFSLAPLYLWMVNMDGSMGVGPINQDINVDFGSIFDNLEAVFTVHFDAVHKSNIGFFLDYSYLDIGFSGNIGPVNIPIDIENTLAELGAFYRFSNGQQAFDILGGLRYTNMDTNIKGPVVPRSMSEDWTDPIIGVRYFYDFGNKWSFWARGDIGGFGLGCDFTWNVLAMVQYQPWKYVAIAAGYRALDQDYEDGSGANRFAYDMRLAGPIVGFNIVW